MAAVDNLRRFTAEAFSDLRAIPGNTVPALLRRLEKSRHETTKRLVELLQQWKSRADGIQKKAIIFSVLLQADMLPLAPRFTNDGTSGAAHGQHEPTWYHLRWFPLRMRCDRDGTCCLMVYIGDGWEVIHADDFKTLWDYSHGLFNGELLADSTATGHAAVGLHRADTRVVQERVSTVDWPAWLGRGRADQAEYLNAVYEDIALWVERAGLPANWGSDATRLVLLPLLAKRFPTEYAFAFLCLYGLWWPLETTVCTGQPASAAAPPAPSAPYPAPITSPTAAPAAPPAPAPETAPAPAPVAASEALEASTKPPAKRQRTSNTAAQLGGAKDRLPPPPGATIIDLEADNATTGESTYSSSSGTAVASSQAGACRTPGRTHASCQIQD